MPEMAFEQSRPTGITMLVIYMAACGVVFIVIGLNMTSLLAFFLGPYLAGILGVVYIGFGAASFFVAFGLFTGKSWAWKVAVAVNIIMLVGGALIDLLILYYLFRPHVKEYFGQDQGGGL